MSVRGTHSAYGLSARQMEVLGRLCLGECDKEIARALGIARGTVLCHTRHLRERMGVRTRLQIVCKAYREQLVRVEC